MFNKSDPVLHQFVVQTESVINVELGPIHAGGEFYCLLSVQETFSDPYLLITHTHGPVVDISDLPRHVSVFYSLVTMIWWTMIFLLRVTINHVFLLSIGIE